MKHTLKVTIALVLFFFMAQFAGLLVTNHYIDHKKTAETKTVVFSPLPYGFERPEVQNQSYSFIYISIAILIGTVLVLLLVKFNKPNIIIQNLSEIFIYGGLAAVFVPMINLFAAFMLLIVISIYDFIAVYKTKHMVKLAKFQSESE